MDDELIEMKYHVDLNVSNDATGMIYLMWNLIESEFRSSATLVKWLEKTSKKYRK